MMNEATRALEWAKNPGHDRLSLESLARQMGRTPEAILHFLRRALPPEQRPWRCKPRWRSEEVDTLLTQGEVESRSRAAAYKKFARSLAAKGSPAAEIESDRQLYTVREIAASLGVSRARVYRFVRHGYLKRFKGGIAESSFKRFLKEHPDLIPYSRLPLEMKEWLVLMGYEDDTITVKVPSVKGWLKGD